MGQKAAPIQTLAPPAWQRRPNRKGGRAVCTRGGRGGLRTWPGHFALPLNCPCVKPPPPAAPCGRRRRPCKDNGARPRFKGAPAAGCRQRPSPLGIGGLRLAIRGRVRGGAGPWGRPPLISTASGKGWAVPFGGSEPRSKQNSTEAPSKPAAARRPQQRPRDRPNNLGECGWVWVRVCARWGWRAALQSMKTKGRAAAVVRVSNQLPKQTPPAARRRPRALMIERRMPSHLIRGGEPKKGENGQAASTQKGCKSQPTNIIKITHRDKQQTKTTNKCVHSGGRQNLVTAPRNGSQLTRHQAISAHFRNPPDSGIEHNHTTAALHAPIGESPTEFFRKKALAHGGNGRVCAAQSPAARTTWF